jgi:hypothetical protein
MINHPNRSRRKAAISAAPRVRATRPTHEHDYSALLLGVRHSFAAIAGSGAKLFQTNAENLNALYLDSLSSERQVHNCSCCRRFIETYGSLVMVADDGTTIPVMWNPDGVPEFYRTAFAAMYARVKKARVTSIFLTKQTTWGNPVTGDWSHISVQPPASMVYRERALTAGQAMAAAKENFRTVATALTEFKSAMLDEALRLLQAATLARSEKFIGPVKWLRTLHDRPKGKLGENILWLAIATAPEGYCHPKASVIGPLLDDIVAGLPFAEIKARFDAKMYPLAYQRPQAAPAAGNIRAAEELVAKLGIAPSLERRFARLDDIRATWLPPARREAMKAGGVFGHIKPKDDAGTVRPVNMPSITMTWDKFMRVILPDAQQLEIHVPYRGRFIAMTTAAHADAPPILKWDREDERNPVAWYCYNNGSEASQWRLTAGTWAKVNAITPFPNLWGTRPMPFLSDGVILIIDGAADIRTGQGNALFPECLRVDIHGARAVIEAYSRSAPMAGQDQASACGYDIRKGAADCLLRTLAGASWTTYRIDRWD